MKVGHTPQVVLVGAGFGGLEVAKGLRRAPIHLTVLDRTNHHLFQPLLYQVATAGLSPAEIASPIRSLLRKQKNTRVLLGEVTDVDLHEKYVQTAEGPIPYDYLILAMGAQTSYFGHESQWAPFALGLKTLEDALRIRSKMLLAFEEAERETDAEKRKALMTFVVIGGGPTGVELAGALCELSRHVLSRDFRFIHPNQARVILVEAGPRILSSFHEKLSASAMQKLQELGAEVRLQAKVTQLNEQGVYLGEEFIGSRCILWGAGIKASPLTQKLGVPLDSSGRILVEPDLTLPGYPDVFAIGDATSFLHQGAKPLPGTSPVAMQQGRLVAKSICAMIQNKTRRTFHFFDKGNMATIGRAAAIAERGRLRLQGFIAWLAWLFIHVFFLIGFRNRMIVLFQWFWSYITYQKGARLITQSAENRKKTEVVLSISEEAHS